MALPPALAGPGASRTLPPPSPYAAHWRLDPSVVFLNHGSFGAVPRTVCQRQREIQDLLQAEPIRFFVEYLEPMLDDARREVAPFLGCTPDDFAFVHNATAGVNTVVRSLRLQPGDEIITSTQEYNACNNVLRWAEEQWGARVVLANVPFPVRSPDEVTDAFVAGVTPRTRLALVSHITSPTAVIQPIDTIVAEMSRRSVETLVDSAHGPGMLPMNVAGIGGSPGAAYVTGNFHKWCCAPNGAAFLYVRPDLQHQVRPLTISHGANSKRSDRSRFRLEFDYVGTEDPSPWLCVPEAIRFGAGLLPGGWEELRARNRKLALDARDLLCRAFGTEPPAPDGMIGSMACIRLPDRSAHEAAPLKYHDPLQEVLLSRYRVQVPIIPFPAPPTRYVRVAAHAHNSMEQFEYLAAALKDALGMGGR